MGIATIKAVVVGQKPVGAMASVQTQCLENISNWNRELPSGKTNII